MASIDVLVGRVSQAPWFFAPPDAWNGDSIVLPAEESRHAVTVMRVAPPDVITVIDGRGTVARCAVTKAESAGVVAEVLERDERRPLKPEIVVYQGAAKGQKNDDVIERLAELGLAECWVYESKRSVVRWDDEKRRRLDERWRALARSAGKQSRNPHVLRTGAPLSWTELVRRVTKEPVAILLWEEAMLPMRTAFVDSADRIALVVGPEGGLERAEAEALADAGAQLVSLGPRILRTENAALVAASALMYHHGLIG